MASAAWRGATHEDVTGVQTRLLRATKAGPEDLLWAQALLLGTPENFGYMSGGLKGFLDRTFYPVEGKVQALPYAIFVSAGNDGSGAVRAIQRIANGYPFKQVQEPVIAKGDLTTAHLERCEALGMAFAFGLETGVF